VNTPQYTVADIRKALRASRGMVFLAAEKLGCSEATIRRYINRHDELKQVLREERGKMTDVAESALAKAIIEGQAWAVQFYLKTQGKNRGFTERHEVVGLTEEQVDAAIERELADAGSHSEAEVPEGSEGTAPPPADEDPDNLAH
jgi:hypothetical protein